MIIRKHELRGAFVVVQESFSGNWKNNVDGIMYTIYYNSARV